MIFLAERTQDLRVWQNEPNSVGITSRQWLSPRIHLEIARIGIQSGLNKLGALTRGDDHELTGMGVPWRMGRN
jgi:hypothetical protein